MIEVRSIAFILMMTIAMSTGAIADNSCGMCTKIRAQGNAVLNNPACQKDPACVKCVQGALLNSNSGLQCSAASAAKTGNAGEIIFATINTAATLTCATACTISLTTGSVISPAERAWAKVCGWTGMAVTATEVAYTIEQMISGEKIDYVGLAMQAYGAKSSVATLSSKGVTQVLTGVSERRAIAGKMIANPACMNFILFGVAAAAKIKSVGTSGGIAASACANAQQFADAPNATFQSCLTNPTSTKSPNDTQAAGFFAATVETFHATTVNDVKQLAASAANDGLKSMAPDMQAAIDQGKLDMAAIGQKLRSGAGISEALSGAGINPILMDAMKNAEEQVKNSNTTQLMAVLGQGSGTTGYAATGGGADPHAGTGDLSFGSNSALPGEGFTSLEIDRNPAGSSTALSDDADVFHGTYSGTIFDIVTSRLKAQKSDYAELDPESRMNRLFNGYGEPGSKAVRKPASRSGQSAK